MNTQMIKINPEEIDKNTLKEAAKILGEGGLVAFPTETVYGLGANALDEDAVKGIFVAKGRPSDNPLIVHIAEKDDVYKIAINVPQMAQKLIDAFSPGPLTVILKKQPFVSSIVTGGLDTVAIRIPAHPIARELIRLSGVPVAAPSANLSGKPSPTMAKHVIEDMNGRIDCIIDGGPCSVGLESTVVDMTGQCPVILRPGGVTLEDIKQIIPTALLDSHVLSSISSAEAPRSPGMKYKHYAPKAEVTVVEGEHTKVREKIRQLCSLAKADGKKVGVIVRYGEEASYPADCVLTAGYESTSYAASLFANLRKFDENGIEVVFAEFKSEAGMGVAVQNRLYKAANNRVIHV
ncbi:MAG: L-threonylcarbamoyladenylate synthase [Clostridia bacterium]|nr:L-threonylcarbamoyladenylate synthase [Clostridia bacterium]